MEYERVVLRHDKFGKCSQIALWASDLGAGLSNSEADLGLEKSPHSHGLRQMAVLSTRTHCLLKGRHLPTHSSESHSPLEKLIRSHLP
jgi:hypothetical protein